MKAWYKNLRSAKSCWHEPAKNIVVITAWILGTMWSVLTFLTYSIILRHIYPSIKVVTCMQVCEWKNLRLDIVEEFTLSPSWDTIRCLSSMMLHQQAMTMDVCQTCFPRNVFCVFRFFFNFLVEIKICFLQQGKTKNKKK